MVYVGKHSYVLIGKESTWGTAVSCSKDIGLVQTVTLSEDNSLRRLHTIAKRNANQILAGRYATTLSIEALFQHGRLLEYAFGSVTHTDGTTDAKHTFSEADTLPSFTMETGFNASSDTTLTFAGCKVNSLTLALSLEGQLTMRADLIAKTVATGTSASASVVSSLTTFPDYMATIKTGSEGGETALGNVQSLEFTIRNNLEPLGKLGSRLIQDLQANEREYEFAFTMAFSSKDEYERFLGGSSPTETSTPTIPSVIIDINNGVEADSGRRQIYIKLSNCSYSAVRTPVVIRGYILQDFTGWAESISEVYTYDNILSSNW